MATKIVLLPGATLPPLLANPAGYASAAGTNSPVEFLTFDAATEQSAFWAFIMPSDYAGGDITVTFLWNAASGTANGVVWGASLLAVTPNTDSGSIEAESFGTEDVSAADTHLGTTAKRLHSISCTLTGAELDSVAAGDWCQFRARRKVADAADTMTGNAQLVAVELAY